MTISIVAVFFDFAGTLFDDRDLRDIHLQPLRFVAAAAGIDAADDPLRSAYRQGMGVAYRAIAGQPSYLHRTLFAASATTWPARQRWDCALPGSRRGSAPIPATRAPMP